jgi:hypothetical protein
VPLRALLQAQAGTLYFGLNGSNRLVEMTGHDTKYLPDKILFV